MNKTELLNSTSLTSALNRELERLHKTEMPSLKVIQAADPSAVQVDFDVDHDEPLRLSRPDGKAVNPGVRNMADSWIEMVQKVVAPGAVVSFRANLAPAVSAPLTTSPLYLGATVMAVMTWPAGRPWPGDLQFGSCLRVALQREGARVKVHPNATFGTAEAYIERLNAEMPKLEDVSNRMNHFWTRSCEKLAPWLDDGGIEDLMMITPIYPIDEPSRFRLGTRVH